MPPCSLTPRRHPAGTSPAIAAIVRYVTSLNPWWLPAALVSGHGRARIGHFFHGKSRPATFGNPCYAFRADCVMYWQMLTAKLSW